MEKTYPKSFINSADFNHDPKGFIRCEFVCSIQEGSQCANQFQDGISHLLRIRKKFSQSFSVDQNRFYDDLLAHLEFEDI